MPLVNNHRIPCAALLGCALAITTPPAFGHGGGTDAQGCHTQKATGDYHCHSGGKKAGRKASSSSVNETYCNEQYCDALGGQREITHTYSGGSIRIDCETATHVIEGGLDKRTSLDSVQQALFASSLTGKQPAVAIYNTDGRIGKYEYRIQTAARRAGIHYANPTYL